ncbi:MAG: xanthine dehydrogenase family protein, partial [Gammaproteobacteria bacterium]|nr:xanthine dehydrogenase family protein [Gammaproteobacteria bacterium]
MDVPDKPKLKDKKEYQYIGKSIPRHDQKDAITGKVIYGTDAKIPGLKYAAIRHCPVLGGKLKSLDKSATLKMKGAVDVVEIPRFKLPYGSIGGVAVVADDSWTAEQALNKLVIEWDPGANQVYNTKTYKQQLVKNVEKPAEVALERGNLSEAFSHAKKKMSATYTAGHLSHSPMEPNASLVWVKE